MTNIDEHKFLAVKRQCKFVYQLDETNARSYFIQQF